MPLYETTTEEKNKSKMSRQREKKLMKDTHVQRKRYCKKREDNEGNYGEGIANEEKKMRIRE